jgi:hypothetical protein
MQWLSPILFSFGIAVAAVVGLLLIRRRSNHAALSKHNDVAGVVFSIVGTLYTVLLAFVVIVVWQNMGDADNRAALEAGVLGDLLRDARLFPDPEKTELQGELMEYLHAVIDEEWPAMATGDSSQHVWEVLTRMFDSFSRIQPLTPRDTNVHAEMLKRLNELSDHRRLRLLAAEDKVPGLMWAVLIIGGVITVLFSYFLGVERTRSHALMTAALASMISLTLYLILAIDHPFAGTIRVDPDAFQLILDKAGPALKR